MRAVAAISTRVPAEAAATELGEALSAGLGGESCDLVVIYLGAAFVPHAQALSDAFRRRFPKALLLGVTGAAVIGAGREVEAVPACSAMAFQLPEATAVPLHFEGGAHPGSAAEPWEWRRFLALGEAQGFLLYVDPFSCDVEGLLRGLDRAWPGVPKVGGLASGGRGPGLHALFLGQKVLRGGAVGVAFRGEIRMDPIVAQGCRPLGNAMRITRCEANRAVSLDDRPAAEMLADVLSEEGPAGRTGASRLALVGLGPPGARDEPPAAGHWLIRNVLGIERGKGALAIGAALREGQWIRFHVRDPDAARADLQRALQDRPAGVHQAALLHACLGRGRALHGDPDVEVGIVQRALGPLATAGLFCGGEIGPVGGATWLHAYTQSVALLRA